MESCHPEVAPASEQPQSAIPYLNQFNQSLPSDDAYPGLDHTSGMLTSIECLSSPQSSSKQSRDPCQQIPNRLLQVLSYWPVHGCTGTEVYIRAEILDHSLQAFRFIVAFGFHGEWAAVNLCYREGTIEAYIKVICPVLLQGSTQYPLTLRIFDDDTGLCYDQQFGVFSYEVNEQLVPKPFGIGSSPRVRDTLVDTQLASRLPVEHVSSLLEREPWRLLEGIAQMATSSMASTSTYSTSQRRDVAPESSSPSTSSNPSENTVSKSLGDSAPVCTNAVGSIHLQHRTSGVKENRPLAPRHTMYTTPALVRTSQLANNVPLANQTGRHSDLYRSFASKAVLKIDGDLESMARDWNDAEHLSGRRLVEFKRKQSGKTISVSIEPVMLAQRSPSSFCVSCIYWKEKDEAYVTSVDTIHLLEYIVGIRFTVEEKNRIRRNLEGFHPLTVSKTKVECGDFFSLVMGFPYPKPRNIEKDVKVFPWKKLGSALRKIIGKYSATPASAIGPLDSVTAPTAVDPTDSRHDEFGSPGQGITVVGHSQVEDECASTTQQGQMSNSQVFEPGLPPTIPSNEHGLILDTLDASWAYPHGPSIDTQRVYEA